MKFHKDLLNNFEVCRNSIICFLQTPSQVLAVTRLQLLNFIQFLQLVNFSFFSKSLQQHLQNMKVQFSINLIIWFKVWGKLVMMSLTERNISTDFITFITFPCWSYMYNITLLFLFLRKIYFVNSSDLLRWSPELERVSFNLR